MPLNFKELHAFEVQFSIYICIEQKFQCFAISKCCVVIRDVENFTESSLV